MKAKKVLILGGLGFIGKNLYKYLKSQGHSVTILSESIQDSGDGFLTSLVKEDIVLGSILNAGFMQELVVGFEVIYSLAGSSGAADSIANPFHDLDTNLRGHLTILEACRKYNSKALLVFPSSRLIYGKPLTNPVNELHPIQPESIYAIHKFTTEQYYLSYKALYGIPCLIFRIANPFGPYQKMGTSKYGILNWFIHRAINHQTIELFGDGSQQRDFLYVDDLCSLLTLAISHKVEQPVIYNVGSGSGVSLADAVKTIQQVIPDTKIVFKEWPVIDKKIETGDYISDIQLAEKYFNWKPLISFKEGIQRTIQFYQSIHG